MNRRSKGGEGHRLLSEKMKSALCGLTLLFSPYVALTQNVVSYHLGQIDAENLKNYAVAYGSTGESAMVGTSYVEDPSTNIARERIHFLINDGTATPPVNEMYFDNDFAAEYGVDVEYIGNDEYLITALARPDPNGPYFRDMIRVLHVDNTGTLLNQWLINTYTTDPTDWNNMYPIHAIYHDNLLYICGYLVQGDIAGMPDFTTPKKAFALHLNPNNGALTARAYEYTNSVSSAKDYDMAMRLIPLANGQDIFLTGSMTATASGALLSGVMSKRVNETTLVTLPIGGDQSFRLGGNAYGVGLMERSFDQNYAENYILGNFFSENSGGNFAPQPQFFWVNRINGNFTYSTSPVSNYFFIGFDFAWALQGVRYSFPVNAYGLNILIAGMQQENACDPTNYPSSNVNINPFLASLNVRYNTTTGIDGDPSSPSSNGLYLWKTYLNQAGTGNPTTDPTSYPRLFGWVCNMAWNPTFAAEDPQNNGIIMSAPRKDFNTRLALKYIRTDNSFDVPSCPGAVYNECYNNISFTYDNAAAPNATASDVALTVAQISPGTPLQFPYSFWQIDDCAGTQPPSVFRTTGIANINENKNIRTRVYPNPAGNFINAEVSGIAPETKISIRLMNLMGQDVATLYDGAVDALAGNQLILPSVASGLYMVHVYMGGQMISQQKLAIQ